MNKYGTLKRLKVEDFHFECISCGKKLEIYDKGSYIIENLDDVLINGGAISEVFCGFGSELDQSSYAIILCDECLRKKGKLIVDRLAELIPVPVLL